MRDLVLAVNPAGALEPGPRITAAACAGGGTGLLDLAGGGNWVLQALTQAATWASGPIGVRVPGGCTATVDEVERAAPGAVDLVLLTADAPWQVGDVAARYRVLVEVTSLAEARAAAAAGAHGLVARGMEAGGRVSEQSSFILFQQLVAGDTGDLPVWVAGGIGPRTAGACLVGGAAGVLLDSQLALMPEAELPADVQAAIRRMDGSETVLVGAERGLRRGGPHDETSELLPIGQDGWLAAVFAERWPDTAAAVRGIRESLLATLADDSAGEPLLPGAPLAEALGVRMPVAQGPMTRVSDEAGFAAAVAGGGGLPFVALALNGPEQSRRILTETAGLLGDRPWGVGVLGFAPDDIRAAQLDVIREIRPACAIIAGGRPPQAKALEAEGIRAFLHVPSPGLLRQFLRAGARRFVFEGAECGGHVGPRASFPLWEAQLLVLDEYLDGDPSAAGQVEVFFAGGIHDARSAAMVAAMAAPLTRRGARIGVLMGTAYLFTEEAVTHGAIQPLFQRMAVDADRTALLETAPGTPPGACTPCSSTTSTGCGSSWRPPGWRAGRCGNSSNCSTSAGCGSPVRAAAARATRSRTSARTSRPPRDSSWPGRWRCCATAPRPSPGCTTRSPAPPPPSTPTGWRGCATGSPRRPATSRRHPRRSTSPSSAWPACCPARRTWTVSGVRCSAAPTP
ncbi:hypothetical protein Prubr_50580 [Polymorphospora rubra]|uniref:Nitronate monooxygenase domain-containing protein n=1 Tax=Polymorphospora rubra TaxID=338584 RepID=A0A810N3Y1_9ACTN|nr:hypothetical protein Prubr_50580 [Polymorphospora rubra]